ncbi:MAG: antibiotic biosynthesis monooxygenase family protein [Gaiellaceae bacterium]
MYTSGVWNVKAGREDEFARGWQATVDRTSLEHPGVAFRLLRDVDKPGRFISMVGPWRSRAQFESVRASEAFRESMSAMSDVLDSYEISAYELAVEVS